MVVCALTLAAVGTSCGYRRVDLTQTFPPEVRRIEIHVFENTTLEPGFGTLLSDALVEEFARRGALDPVYAGQGGSADHFDVGAFPGVRANLDNMVSAQDLSDTVASFGPADFTGAYQFNFDTIAPGETTGSVFNSIPEPNTASMMLIGLVGLGGLALAGGPRRRG